MNRYKFPIGIAALAVLFWHIGTIATWQLIGTIALCGFLAYRIHNADKPKSADSEKKPETKSDGEKKAGALGVALICIAIGIIVIAAFFGDATKRGIKSAVEGNLDLQHMFKANTY